MTRPPQIRPTPASRPAALLLLSARLAVVSAVLVVAPGCRRQPPPPVVLVTITGWPVDSTDGPAESPDQPRAVLRISSVDLAASAASILTGRDPAGHGLRGIELDDELRPSVRTVGEAASAAGFRTAAFLSSRELMRAPGLVRGFSTVDPPADSTPSPRSPADTARAAATYIAGLDEDATALLWIDLEARTLANGGSRTELAAAIDTIDRALSARYPERPKARIVVGILGAEVDAGLAEDRAARVRFQARLPETGDLALCSEATTAVAELIGRIASFAPFPCDEMTSTESPALGRRFGLQPILQGSNLVSGGVTTEPLASLGLPELRESLAARGLPSPSGRENWIRKTNADPRAFAGAIRDQRRASERQEGGHPASARALFERALEADPLAVEALVATSRIAAASGQAQEASSRLRTALPEYPDRPEIYHSLGHVAFLLESYDEARLCILAALVFRPDDPELLFDLAVNEAALGNGPNALEALERSVEHGFDGEKLLLSLPHFQPYYTDARFRSVVQLLRSRS